MSGRKYHLASSLLLYLCLWTSVAHTLGMTNLLVYLCDNPEKSTVLLLNETYMEYPKGNETVEIDVTYPGENQTNNNPITCMIVNSLDDNGFCQIPSGGIGETHVSFKFFSDEGHYRIRMNVILMADGP